MTALLVLRAILTLLLLRGADDPAPRPDPTDPAQDEDDAAGRFLSADAAPAAPDPASAAAQPAPAGAPVRRRRTLWPGWAKLLAAAVPFAGVAIGLAAVALMVARATQPDAVPTALADDSTILALVLVSLSVLAVWILWRVPQWQAAAWAEQAGATPRERFEIENASRGTLGQILSGVAVLAGLIFAWQQLGSTTRSVQLSEQGQLTDRFSSAIGQLASEDLAVRLGGIYALEQIARDNPRDYAAAMQVLAAIVRGDEPADDASASAGPLPQDVIVAMTVIGRRTTDQLALQVEQGIPCLDLRGARLPGLQLSAGANLRALCLDFVDLSGASLIGADFTGSSMLNARLEQARLDRAVLAATLSEADLDRAFFNGARLDGANLAGASLEGAFFLCTTDPDDRACASLRDANLLGANLAVAFFDGADLTATDFSLATLTGATFLNTDLSSASGLTTAQLATAFVGPGVPLPPAPASPAPAGSPPAP